MQEDVLLVHQTLSGDEKAYHRLFRKYQKAIYARILSMVQNPADAEELTADVFIKAYQNLSSLRQPGRFFWWVVRIARNHSQNWLQRHQTPFLSLEDVPVGELPSTNSAEDELLRQERYQKVLEALDTLPDVDRELMKGFYFEGASYDALQKRHGLSKKAVAMRLVKARRKVREKVEKMLSGMVVFPWRDFLEKLFLGGMQVVKLSATTKLVTVWTATLLMLGGIITVSVWHDKSSKQFMSKQVITQASQETPQKTSGYLLSKQKPSVTPVQKSANQTPATDSVQAKQTGDADLNSFWAELAALEAGSETDYVEISTETAENEVSSEPTPEQLRRVQEIITEIPILVSRWKDLRAEFAELGKVPHTPEIVARRDECCEEYWEIHHRLFGLACRYAYLTGNYDDIYPGGWIGELLSPIMRIGSD